MAQTGYTPIYLYYSGTATHIPLAANLGNGELAINAADGNLFYKNTSNAVVTIPVLQSSSTQSGWLSSTDWNTFNSKAPAGAYLTSVTADSPLTGAGTSASHLSMPAATGSVNGYLTSTDWTTFNSKQPAGTYVTSVSGTAPVVSSGGTTPAISMAAATSSANGYLTSTDWSTFNGKQAALVSGTNIKTVSGTTLLGSGDLGTIGVGYGGTGTSTAFTAGSIVYAGASGVYSQDNANLFWDATNHRLGVGNTAPGTTAQIYAKDDTAGTGLSVAYNGTYYTRITEQGYYVYNNPLTINAVSNYQIDFKTNNAQVARIFASGGVSIGNTTDPGAGALSVTGSATIQGLTVGKGASAVATNSAFGVSALQAVTTGSYNSGLGYQAGYSIQGGAENCFVGGLAGYSTTSGGSNTFIGTNAAYTNSTSSNSVAVGSGAAYSMTGGSNTAIGTSAAGNLTSGTNNTAIGYAAGNSSGVINLTTQSNRVVVGDANVTNAYILVAWTVTSDARDKTNIQAAPYGLDFVKKLNPISYQWDKRVNYEDGVPDGSKKEDKTYLGFLAQDVVELEKEFGGQSGDLLIADDEMEESLKITETKMIPVLVKALQELNAKFEAYVATHP